MAFDAGGAVAGRAVDGKLVEMMGWGVVGVSAVALEAKGIALKTEL